MTMTNTATLPPGWDLPTNGAMHRSLKSAQATAKWLNAQKRHDSYEYRGVTLSDGSYRVIRRRKRNASR